MAISSYQIVVALAAFVSVLALGSSLVISHQRRRAAIEVRLRESQLMESEGGGEKQFNPLRALARVGNLVSHGHSKKNLGEHLLRAGYLSLAAPAVYTGIKILLFSIGLIASAIFLMPMAMPVTTKATLALSAGAVLSFIPNFVVAAAIDKRKREIHNHLPEAVDLLEVCVSSGIGLDMAWNIVADEMKQVSGVLANAMNLTSFETNLGVNRVEAMKHMAERTGVEQLSSLASILIQTERFGTSIASTLKVFAGSMREERAFAAEENAEKMAVKLIFPMAVFIFPALLVTLAGPAFLSLSESFS